MNVALECREMGRRQYRVTRAHREWVAIHHVRSEDWHVVNEKGVELVPFGDLWMKIVEACESWARKNLDVESL